MFLFFCFDCRTQVNCLWRATLSYSLAGCVCACYFSKWLCERPLKTYDLSLARSRVNATTLTKIICLLWVFFFSFCFITIHQSSCRSSGNCFFLFELISRSSANSLCTGVTSFWFSVWLIFFCCYSLFYDM